MKAASAGLIALLNSGSQFFMADLYSFTLVGGTVLRYTGYDVALVSGGNTFAPLPIKRGAIREQVGINVEQLVMDVFADATNLVNATAFLTAAAQGALDGARLQLERVFMPTIGDTSLGTLVRFLGRVSDIVVSRTKAQITVKSDMELLNIQMPRNIYQPGCVHTLFDAGCTLVKANFAVAGTASAGATASVVPCSLSQAAGYFDLGTVLFTSGANNGVLRSVKSYTPGNLVLARPLLAVPVNGDTLTATPGCDKLQSTCGINSAIVFTRSGNLLLATAHGLVNDEALFVASTGTLPSPLSAATRYFVVNRNANDFQVALTIGGPPVTLTTAGSGTHTVAQHGKFSNLPNFRGYPFIPRPETVF